MRSLEVRRSICASRSGCKLYWCCCSRPCWPLAVTSVVDGWADWVVLGGILVAVFGMMIAVNNRRYPTRKRSFTKDSDSKW